MVTSGNDDHERCCIVHALSLEGQCNMQRFSAHGIAVGGPLVPQSGVDLQRFELTKQGAGIDAEFPGGRGAIALVTPQRLLDHEFLHLPKRCDFG